LRISLHYKEIILVPVVNWLGCEGDSSAS